MSRKLLDVLERKKQDLRPLWLMRQAGRYLPEYRAIREQAGSFWTMCLSPELAAEVTLQPVRRFGFDAAIIFSDILVVPAALGVCVTFEAGEGPKLAAVTSGEGLEIRHENKVQYLEPVYRALELVRASLGGRTALLGFAGAPWTLATYMAAGGGGDEQKAAKLWSYRDPEGFGRLVDVLADSVAQHLIAQLKAGADAVQIFDSWAQGLAPGAFENWVVAPTKRVIDRVRSELPGAKIIGFPRGSTLSGYQRYAQATGVDAISLDTAVPMGWAAAALGSSVALQGNIDPIALIAGGRALRQSVENILDATRGVSHIFNLGHGILPETPVAHVEELVRLVRGGA